MGCEADDLIFGWSSYLNSVGRNSIILSGDNDLIQLVHHDATSNTNTIYYNKFIKSLYVYPGFTEWIANDTGGELTGENFGISNLINNSLEYGKYLFNNRYNPYLFVILFISGAVLMFLKRRKEALFLLSWFLLLWFVYFGSWFQTLGGNTTLFAKIRFFMSFYPILVIFMGYGIFLLSDFISKKLIKKDIFFLILLIVFLLFIPYSNEAAKYSFDSSNLETKIPELAEIDIPSNCIIVANLPTILKSTTELNVVDLDIFLESKDYQLMIFNEYDCILFFEDITCDIWEHQSKLCIKIKEDFLLEEFISYEYNDERFVFYTLSKE